MSRVQRGGAPRGVVMAIAAVVALGACTPAPTAPDVVDPGGDDVAAQPPDDAVDPGSPDVVTMSSPDVLTSAVTPGMGTGARSAPRTAGALPSASCTNLGYVTVPDDLLTPEILGQSGSAVAVATGVIVTYAGAQWAIWSYFVGRPASGTNTIADLGLYPETAWDTASHIVLIGGQCHGSGSTFACDRYYFQQSGTAVYYEIAAMPGQRLRGHFYNVVATEARFDSNDNLVPVAGGSCVTISGYRFNSRPLPVPTTPDAATGFSGELSGGEAGAGATASGPVPRPSCSASNTLCSAETPDCIWTGSSNSGVCTRGCRYSRECPEGFTCVAMGSEGRCFLGCVTNPCADNRLACTAVADSLRRSTGACLPPEWYAPARCGDHACNAAETCSTCSADCGACP